MDRRRIVEVLGTRTGSGLLLADRLVLTAAHLLVPPGAVLADERSAGEVAVRLVGGEKRYAARCVWMRYVGHDRGLDAALLEITSPDWTLAVRAGVRLGRLAGSAEARVHAFGFPDAAVLAGVAELSPVTGVVHTDSGARSGRPEIVVDRGPERGPGGVSLWAGLSGGPVFGAPGGVTSDVLLGIIASDPAEFASRRLRIIPAAAVLADSEAAAIIERLCGSIVVILYPEPDAALPQVRYSLPPDTAAFIGRDAELARITAAATSAAGDGEVVTVGAIDGMPGVGKTALAVHVAHGLADRFPDRQLFINLHAHTLGREPVDPADALAGLLTAVGVDPRFIPEDPEGRAAMWRDKMAGQQALLVLDNAASSTQVTPLLPGGRDCLVLVTSRRHLDDLDGVTVSVVLGVLPDDQAEEMFTRLAPGATADPDRVAEVVELAGFLPLAVSLLARVFARHPAWTLADLAAETRARLLTIRAEHGSVSAAFELSYRHLDPVQQRFFDLLGMHPGITDSYAAAALAGISVAYARWLLDALHKEGLLTETGYRRYGMHDVLRHYARDHTASVPDRDQAQDRLLDYYQHGAAIAQDRLARQTRPGPAPTALPTVPVAEPALDDPGRALVWVRSERDNLLACLDYVTRESQHVRVIALTDALAALWWRDGPWTEAITRLITASQSAQRLGDRLGQASAFNNLGTMRQLIGDYAGAVVDLEQALAIYRDIGDRLGQANVLSNLGNGRRLTGDFQLAVADLEQALAIYRDLDDQLGQANTHSDLGTVRYLTGDYPGAPADLEQALAIYRDIGDGLGQANTLSKLGTVRRLSGDYRGAYGDQVQAMAIYRDLGYRLGLANALSELELIRRDTGDYAGAVADLEEALVIYRDLGNRLGQANTLTEFGNVRYQTGDYPSAAQDLEQALAIYRDLGHRLGRAGALLGLGSARRETGDYHGAVADLEQALGIYRDLGNRAGEAEAFNEIGVLHRISGEPAEAEACHQQALELARATGSAWDEAHALAGLGRCAAAVGHTTRAVTMLRQAHLIFQRIGVQDAAAVLAELNALTRPGPGQ